MTNTLKGQKRAPIKTSLSFDRAHELFSYDAVTGALSSKIDTRRIRAGQVVGSPEKNGYLVVSADKAYYKAHRVIWLMQTGAWPIGDVDHVNGDPADNRIANLRDVSHAANTQNRRAPQAGNKAGLLGVTSEADGRFRAVLQVNGKKLRLGRFKTPEAAQQAYLAAKRIHHAGCTL
jgi:hypothetical protein